MVCFIVMDRFVSVYSCVRALNVSFIADFVCALFKQLDKNYIHDHFFSLMGVCNTCFRHKVLQLSVLK